MRRQDIHRWALVVGGVVTLVLRLRRRALG